MYFAGVNVFILCSVNNPWLIRESETYKTAFSLTLTAAWWVPVQLRALGRRHAYYGGEKPRRGHSADASTFTSHWRVKPLSSTPFSRWHEFLKMSELAWQAWRQRRLEKKTPLPQGRALSHSRLFVNRTPLFLTLAMILVVLFSRSLWHFN